MEYPHCTAEDDKACEVHQDVLPGNDESGAGVNDDNADGSKEREIGMAGFVGVHFEPTPIHPPDVLIQ